MIHTYAMNEILQDKNRNLQGSLKTGRDYRQEGTRTVQLKRIPQHFRLIALLPGKFPGQLKTFPAHWRIEF